MRAVFHAARVSTRSRYARNAKYTHKTNTAAVHGNGTLRRAVRGTGAAADRGTAATGEAAPTVVGAAVGTAIDCVFPVHTRTLAAGSSSAAANPATHTACLCRDGPLRINRQATAAINTAAGTCHNEFSRNVKR